MPSRAVAVVVEDAHAESTANEQTAVARPTVIALPRKAMAQVSTCSQSCRRRIGVRGPWRTLPWGARTAPDQTPGISPRYVRMSTQ